MMKNENFIHVRLGHNETIQSKKDILFSQMNLIRILKSIKNYHILRAEELELKKEIHTKTKDINTNIKKIQSMFPKIPGVVKIPQREKTSQRTSKTQTKDTDLEKELREIQERLKAI